MSGDASDAAMVPLRLAVLTISDTRDEATDRSGALLLERATAAGHAVVDRRIVTDDRKSIEAALQAWVDDPSVQVVIATGGTGITARDVTPEAVDAVIDKRIDGFGELFRWLSYQTIGTSTIQSRAVAGVTSSGSGKHAFARRRCRAFTGVSSSRPSRRKPSRP